MLVTLLSDTEVRLQYIRGNYGTDRLARRDAPTSVRITLHIDSAARLTARRPSQRRLTHAPTEPRGTFVLAKSLASTQL